jgi:hypothetical protein
MEWTLRFFQRKAACWEEKADKAGAEHLAGHRSYALRQQDMWLRFADDAAKCFTQSVENKDRFVL